MQNMYFRKKASRTRCVSTQQAAGLGVWTHCTVVPVSSIEWWWLEWGVNVCRNSRPAAGSQPDPLLGAAQHLTPTVRRPLMENPAWRPSLPEKTGLGVGLLLLSHLIASLCKGLISSRGKELPYSGHFHLRFWKWRVPHSMQVLGISLTPAGALAQNGWRASAPLPGGKRVLWTLLDTSTHPFHSTLLETQPLVRAVALFFPRGRLAWLSL